MEPDVEAVLQVDLDIRVMPKLGIDHVIWLLKSVPQLGAALTSADSPVVTAAGGGFWEVVAHSFVWSTERLLRNDLIRDYRERSDELPYARGRIRAISTTRNLMRGRMQFSVEYEEFSIDTPLNRIVRAAARKVASNRALSRELRQRALRLVTRMEDVGELRAADLRSAVLDRRTSQYRVPITLGRMLLHGETSTWLREGVQASAFLIRTPELIEQGVREAVRARIGPRWSVKKERLPLECPIDETVNPDLVFNSGYAVGDVKYKASTEKWNRPDVYEVVAFAARCGTNLAAVVDFAEGDRRRPDFIIGNTVVHHLAWDLSLDPEDAADKLSSDVQGWLELAVPELALSLVGG